MINQPATNFLLAGAGLSSAIFERQSSCVLCGPVTKVPLTLVEYQPELDAETQRFFGFDVTRGKNLHGDSLEVRRSHRR